MANVIEKIFKLILNFGDGEEKVPKMSKLLQSLHDRLKNILKTINDIGKADGLEKAAEVLGVYTLTVEKAEKAKKKLVVADKDEKTQTAEATKYIEDLKNKYGNLIFTKREIASLSKNYATLMRAEKGSAEELQAKINVLNTVWKKLGATQRNSTAGRQVTAELKSMRDEMRNLTVGAGDFSRNIGNYFSGMYNTVTRKVAGITGVVFTLKQVLWSIYGPFQDLEYRMAMVKAVSRATDEEFVMLKGNARELGASTEYTATEVAGLQLAYARMGFVPDQIRQMTGATLDLATATGEDLPRSADVVGVTLRAFNLQANQTQRVVDVMTKSFNASSLQLSYFYDAIKYVGPIASEANVSLEETAAMLGILADRGIRGSQAGTALRRIFTEIAKEGGNVSERLAELNKRGLTLGGAMDEVGKYAMTALTVLVKSKDGVDGLTESLNNAGGAAKTAADDIRDTMKIDVAVFLSAIQEKLIAIGKTLAPLGRSVIHAGTWAVTNIKSITVALLTFIGVIKLASAARAVWLLVTKQITIYETAWGRVLRVNMVELQTATAMTKLLAAAKLLLAGQVRAATAAFKMFWTAFTANPWGLIIGGIASVISCFVMFRKETSSVSDAYAQSTQSIGKESEAIKDLKDAVEASEDGSVRRRDLINEINEKYGQYLPNLLTEKSTQEEIVTALDSVNKKLEENIRLKYASQIVDEEGKKIVEAENKLIDDLKSLWEKANTGKQMPVETELLIVETVRRQTDASKQVLEDVANGVEDALKRQAQAYTSFMKVMRGELGLAADGVISASGEASVAIHRAATRLFQANTVLVNNPQPASSAPTPTGGGNAKEKGEWSLSKDKDHNRQLLDLKKKLHSGEISSEEQYQKQVLQLEIDTLTKRIALNKDEAKTIIKLKNELWDKQNQQKKSEQKEVETYTANRKAQQEKQLKYENDRIDAEIAAMKEGVEKKIRLNDQAAKKAGEAADKEYQTELDKLNKEQKAYVKGSNEWQAVEQEKTRLAGLYGQKKTDIEKAETDARTKILQGATKAELQAWGELPGKATEAERQITENKRREVEKRLKLAREETANSILKAKNQYDADESVADATLGKKGRKRNVAGVANEVQLHRNQAQAYQQELNKILEGGDLAIEEHKERYNELIGLIGQEQNAAMNLGKGKNADGTRKSFWQQLTELSDEDLNQIKQQAFDLASQLSDAIFNAKQQASQRQLNAEKKAIDAQYKTESKLLDSKRDKGLISEKQYQKELEKLEAKKAAKEEAAEREAFERKKKLDIKQALINTALAVGNALATSKPFLPMGPIMAAFAFAQGMVQVATIASQKYAQGGLIPLGEGMGVIKGRSHAQGGHRIYLDGTPIGEVEGDELLAIVNKHDTARIGALSEANSVHGRRFAQGGIMSPSGYMMSSVSAPVSIGQLETAHRAELARRQDEIQSRQDAVIQALAANIEAINNRIDTLKVVVLAQDMTDTQNNIKKIKVKSSF